MADITLQTLITETADYIKADTDDDDFSTVQARIVSALNEAKNIISQHIRLTTSQSVTLDSNSCFDVSTLTKSFWGLVSVKYNDTTVYTEEQNGLIWCNSPASEAVTVEYEYIPEDMTETTDVYPFPVSVSWRILCCYAASQYYTIKGTQTSLNKAGYWNGKWTNGLNALKGGSKMTRRKIKATYNYGDFE